MTDNERNRFADNFAYLRSQAISAKSVSESEIAQLAVSLKAETPQNAADAFASVTGYGFASAEFAKFCIGYADKPDITALLPNDDGEREEYAPTNAVAYMANRLSNEAFKSFSHSIGSFAPSQSSSFAEAAEKVSYGKADYAVLPYFSTADGAVQTVRKLIRRYDLKVVGVTDVSDEDNAVRFALIARELSSVGRHASTVELTSPIGDASVIAGLASALTVLKATESLMSLEPSEYGGMTLTLTLDTEKSDIFALLMFLKYALPHYTLTGIYNIKENTHGLHG